MNTADDPVEGLLAIPWGGIFASPISVWTQATVLADASKVSPEKPLDGLSLINITGTCTKGMTLANITHAELRDIHVSGYAGALLTQTNVQGVGPRGAQVTTSQATTLWRKPPSLRTGFYPQIGADFHGFFSA